MAPKPIVLVMFFHLLKSVPQTEKVYCVSTFYCYWATLLYLEEIDDPLRKSAFLILNQMCACPCEDDQEYSLEQNTMFLVA